MSTPVLPGQPTALQAARQQLDELDALLERMLALPVDEPEDDPLADFDPVAPVQWSEDDATVEEEPDAGPISVEIAAEPSPTAIISALPAEQTECEGPVTASGFGRPLVLAPDPVFSSER